jgi:hypothetical protein
MDAYECLHDNRNRDRWQHWVSINVDGEMCPVPMPKKYVMLMMAGVEASSYVISGKEMPFHYDQMEGMVIHPQTRRIITDTLLLVYGNDEIKG